jgi:hypothetical protein
VPLYQQVTEQLSTDLQKEIKIGIFGASKNW